MALLGYKKRFVKPIQQLLKEWTIRDFRKIPIKPGERLYMYTGLRTKHCKKIGEAICRWTSQIIIHEDSVCIDNYGDAGEFVSFGNDVNDYRSLDWFAAKDGFKDWDDLKAFWYQAHGKDCFPYTGEIIKFTKVRALPRKKKRRDGRQMLAKAIVNDALFISRIHARAKAISKSLK